MNEWTNFFSVTAESAATLTGLIFVGTSLSLAKLLAIPALTDRALESMILLLNILIVSVITLIPAQSPETTGFKILFLACISWGIILFLDIRIWRNKVAKYARHSIQNTIFSQLATVPYIIGSIMIIWHGYDGIYWLIPGIIISFIKAVIDAWVILVEIHR